MWPISSFLRNQSPCLEITTDNATELLESTDTWLGRRKQHMAKQVDTNADQAAVTAALLTAKKIHESPSTDLSSTRLFDSFLLQASASGLSPAHPTPTSPPRAHSMPHTTKELTDVFREQRARRHHKVALDGGRETTLIVYGHEGCVGYLFHFAEVLSFRVEIAVTAKGGAKLHSVSAATL